MSAMNGFLDKWGEFQKKMEPALKKCANFFKKVGNALRIFWAYVMALKKLILAVPVAVAALILALRNQAQLPAVVGLDLQNNGAFAIQIAREVAVLGPLAITALCLLLMFCSRRTLTPWFVSAVSLLLPVLIWVINTFPG